MWGAEPVTGVLHAQPFVYEYMRPYRIYQICGGKDFNLALGVHARDPVPKPDLELQVMNPVNPMFNTVVVLHYVLS